MTEENKGTAATGSEPVKVEPTAVAGAVPAPDAKVDSSTTEKPPPFDQDVRWKSARLAEQKLQGLLKANDLEDVDDLVALVESGKKVHGKVDDLDNIEELKKKAETLDRYNAHWARQKEIERRQTEDPNETIARLERESNELKTSKARDEQAKKETEEAEKSVKFYEGEVRSIIGDMELSDQEKEFLSWSLGVGNECNDIQITDKRAIKKVVNSGMKKYTDLVKAIKEEGIKSYLAGKESIPIVPSGGQPPASIPVTTLKTASQRLKAFGEAFQGKK
jgi:hypothetical protein